MLSETLAFQSPSWSWSASTWPFLKFSHKSWVSPRAWMSHRQIKEAGSFPPWECKRPSQYGFHSSQLCRPSYCTFFSSWKQASASKKSTCIKNILTILMFWFPCKVNSHGQMQKGKWIALGCCFIVNLECSWRPVRWTLDLCGHGSSYCPLISVDCHVDDPCSGRITKSRGS